MTATAYLLKYGQKEGTSLVKTTYDISYSLDIVFMVITDICLKLKK